MVVTFVREIFPSHSRQYQPVLPMVNTLNVIVVLLIGWWLALFHFAVFKDFNISDQLDVIHVNTSEACFQLVAIDDEVVEDDETYTLIVNALNPNDNVDANTTVIIVDNDGKQKKRYTT